MKYLVIILSFIIILILLIPFASGINNSSTRTPIKHVINIFFENHTFDNLLGIYPEDAYSNSTDNTSIISNISRPLNLLDNTKLLQELHSVPDGIFSTSDPIEGYLAYHQDWNYGKMNGFYNGSGPQSMTYFTASQVSPLWDLAEEYSIADNYFAPQISESAPNTLYYLAGFSPVINDYGPPPYIPINETIFGELNYYGISWGVYVNNSLSHTFDMSQYIYGLNNYYRNIQSWNQFIEQVKNGSLPSVSYVFSQGGNGYDMGAPSNILKGELWLLYIINTIEESPIWDSTAVFVTWDDPGGYFDQVSPPVLDGVQLGFRLPLILISPYSKENYVSSTLMTHSSILSFIDYNWDMPALNKFVSECNIPLDMFDFNVSYQGGYISRPPFVFKNFPIPNSLDFTINKTILDFNYSLSFPLKFQENVNSLPYKENGSSSITLMSLNSGLFVKNDLVLTPFLLSPIAVSAIFIINAVLLYKFYSVRRRH